MASSDNGELIEAGTPLTRNHWFDGKFLRADDLARDQDYHREALRLVNRAGGFGVVEGLEIALAGAELLLQPGLGVTARGELLLLNGELRVGVDALIAASSSETRAAKPGLKGDAAFAPCVSLGQADGPVALDAGLRIYRLTLSRHEALCGHEDVVGSLCERACVSERQRPYRLEGVRLRARRINVSLSEPKGITLDGRHRRSQIASALFARDDADPAPLPRSTGGLLSPLWCAGAELESADELTLAILVRGAGTADFVELWAGRRERMAAQAERYWRRRTRQRPYADFMAQLAQFQCQLYDAFRNAPEPGDGDEPGGDCGSLKALVADLEKQLEAAIAEGDGDAVAKRSAARAQPLAIDWNQAAGVKVMQRIGRFVEASKPLLKGRADRVLIERGIVELPPAGFLPVRPGADVLPQIQALLGPGVQLKVCSAPLDAIGQLLAEGQHSARTSLLRGIADPADKPWLQLIVPDGEQPAAAAPQGVFAIDLQYDPALLAIALPLMLGSSSDGGARNGLASLAGTAGSALGSRLSSGLQLQTIVNKAVVGEGLGRLADAGKQPGFAFAAEGLAPPAGAEIPQEAFAQAWMELQAERDPFTLAAGESIALALELREIDRNPVSPEFPNARLAYEAEFSGSLTQLDPQLDLRGMGQLAAALEIASPAACLVELRGQLRYRLLALGLPAGLPDGFDRERQVDVLAKLVIARGDDGTMQRWQLIWELKLPNSDVPLLIDLLWQRRHSDGRAALRLRLRSPQSPDGSQGMDTASPLASLQPEAGALAAQHPRRLRAERALLALRDGLGDGNGFLARARRRLFGDEQTAAGLRGPHDWLLFRRPVDAVCGAPAPVVQPPPAPEPPPPPPKLQSYRAWVLRLQGPSGRLPIDEAIKQLEEGQLPSTKLSTLGDAGLLGFAAGSSTPQQTEAQLAAAWQAAGFGPLARVAALQESKASTDALARARFAALSPRLGGGTAEPALHRLRGSLPAPLAGSGADGVLVMLVEPPQTAPPPPQVPPLLRGHTLVMLSLDARAKLGMDMKSLLEALRLRGTATQEALTRAGARQLPFPLPFSWTNAGQGTMSVDASHLAQWRQAAGLPGNLFIDPPQLISVAMQGSNTDDMKRADEESLFLIADALSGVSGPAPERQLALAQSPLQLLAGSQVISVILLRD